MTRSTVAVLSAVALAAGPTSAAWAQQPTVGPNVQVSKALSDIGHTECVVAADPNDRDRLLAGSMYYPKGSASSKVVGYYSRDGGKTWQLSCERNPKATGLDPAVFYGPDGAAYLLSLSVNLPKEAATPEEEAKLPKLGNKDVGALLIARSPDGGRTWGEMTRIQGWIDRPWGGVDRSDGKYRGRLYCVGSVGQPVLYVSADEGRSFGPPRDWSARKPYRSFGIGNPVVLSDGTLVVLYNGYADRFQKAGTPYLAVRRSTDGGETVGEEYVVGDWNVINAPQLGLAMLAADPGSKRHKDRLYAAWADETPAGLRVMLSRSADKGLTWSKPMLLSEQPEPKPGEKAYDALIPAVAVNTAGVVALSWYDRRGLPADSKGWNVRLRASLDGGETWLPSVQVNDAGSEKRGIASLGHTAGLAADAGGQFHPTWIDHRTETLQVWTAAVTVPGKL
jgi:BNR/Asp-box repeat